MLRFIFESLRQRSSEYGLAAGVIALPIAALIVVQAVSSTTEKDVHDAAHTLGANMLVVPADIDMREFHALRFSDATLPDDYADRVRASAIGRHIRHIESRLLKNARLEGVDVVLVGEETRDGPGRSVPAPSGRAVLGERLALDFGAVTGTALSLLGEPVITDGVRPTSADGLDRGVFVALPDAQRLLERDGRVSAMRMAGCWCSIDVPALATQVEALLPGTRAITAAGMIDAQRGAVDTVKRYSSLLYGATAAIVAAVVLLLMSHYVRRQRREMGLLLAIGGSPLLLALVVVMRAALMATSGALAGYWLGAPLAEWVGWQLLGSPLSVHRVELAPLLGLTVAAGVGVSFVPALRAARLPPNEALWEM